MGLDRLQLLKPPGESSPEDEFDFHSVLSWLAGQHKNSREVLYLPLADPNKRAHPSMLAVTYAQLWGVPWPERGALQGHGGLASTASKKNGPLFIVQKCIVERVWACCLHV